MFYCFSTVLRHISSAQMQRETCLTPATVIPSPPWTTVSNCEPEMHPSFLTLLLSSILSEHGGAYITDTAIGTIAASYLTLFSYAIRELIIPACSDTLVSLSGGHGFTTIARVPQRT